MASIATKKCTHAQSDEPFRCIGMDSSKAIGWFPLHPFTVHYTTDVLTLFLACARCLVICMSYVVCLIYCVTIGIRLDLDLISLVNVYLFQNYYTGATMKTRLSNVVSV